MHIDIERILAPDKKNIERGMHNDMLCILSLYIVYVHG